MYEEFAQEAPKREIAGVFSALAGEEQRHYEIFDNLEKRIPVEAVTMGSANMDVTDLFETLRIELQIDEQSSAAMNDAETAYKKALVLENSSIDLFSKIVRGLSDGHQKKVVEAIIGEEKRHIEVITGLIEFVHRPKEWLENAEVFHQNQY